jgi:FtsP/CotA-like multicopper oxidase with cupredoxin domain
MLDVATRAYRLRLLNGSNARTYKLAWEDGTPLRVIATDGGLLEHPVERPYVMLSPGERIELWADFSSRPAGAELTLQSLAFEGAEGLDTSAQDNSHSGHGGNAMSGHHGHDMGGHDRGHQIGAMAGHTNAAPPLGAPMTILTVRVTEQAEASDTLPSTLSTIKRYRPVDAVNRANPRTFILTQPGMRWEINGRVYDMTHARVDETVKLGDLEVWQIINAVNEGETMHPYGMVHPFHIHGVQFQVLERQVLPELEAGWRSVRDGYVDDGWKDTVLLMPGERVTLLLTFIDYTGIFMYHCHILEHEDMGMMGNYEVMA